MKKVYDEFDRSTAQAWLLALVIAPGAMGVYVGLIIYYPIVAVGLLAALVGGSLLWTTAWSVRVLWKTRRNA